MSELQLFPALDSATEAALKASIDRFGVLVPVVKDQHGRILDGHHRSRIANELGVKYPVVVIQVVDEEEAAAIVITLNTDRGHRLKTDLRRPVATDLREQGFSLRAIAGALGVDKETVRRDLSTVASATVPERITGLDGKSRPARRPAVVLANGPREAERAQTVLSTVVEATSGPLSIRQAARRLSNHKREERVRESKEAFDSLPKAEDRYHLLTCDLADADIEPASVDFIITDPPYSKEHLPEFGKLAGFAGHALKPGGSLLVMSGQSYLPAVMRLLDVDGLCYQWTLAYLTMGGQSAQMWERRVNTFWKPVLWYTKGEYAGRWIGDVSRSDTNDNNKLHHHWGQSESGMLDLMSRFVGPGDTVCDPFLGGGTTAMVALELGCYFVGMDREPDAVATTARRLA